MSTSRPSPDYRPEPEIPGPGQQSVWTYPRPAIAEPIERHLKVIFDGRVLAETRRGVRTLETSHPPTYYFPPDDVDTTMLHASRRQSFCEWKGQARYFDVVSTGRATAAACWCYPAPAPTFEMLRGFLAFYASLMDACYVDGELATPQPGAFYGGWVTSDLAGPFKGVPGSTGW